MCGGTLLPATRLEAELECPWPLLPGTEFGSFLSPRSREEDDEDEDEDEEEDDDDEDEDEDDEDDDIEGG